MLVTLYFLPENITFEGMVMFPEYSGSPLFSLNVTSTVLSEVMS